MMPDFFTNLPSEITTNILSRLPLRSVAVSKCVCKPWLDLLESDYFVKSHISKTKTAAALALVHSTRCTVLELEDEGEVDLESHDLHYKPLTDFDFPFGESSMEGTAANVFLLLHSKPRILYVCNPITRDYFELFLPEEYIPAYGLCCGFGLSKISGQHKVVCINPSAESDSRHVYTLETGTWRRVEAGAAFGCRFYNNPDSSCEFGKFVNNNLHWSVTDTNTNNNPKICGFDVETECFSIFSRPNEDGYTVYGDLSVFRDCVCVCSSTWDEENTIVIWLMKEYGVEKSWCKEYVIPINPYFVRQDFLRDRYVPLSPIKIFKDGDILMLWNEKQLIYYSNKTKMTEHVGVGMFNDADLMYAMILTPSLLSLKSLRMENVISF